ncbi:MAG: DUF1566 domain-containing protein [Bacteroidales bacterium]|nr:DUF1566 domain-containing protein [Bacteroidales bacterium]
MSATNNILLEYIGVSNGLANFSVYGGGTMPTGDYIGIYPENATVNAYNNIEYTAPNIYYINPAEGKTDDYLTDNLLMYTKTKYYHASGDTAFFIPAMTILEVPIRTDSGSYYINNIKLTAIGPSIWWGSAFVKKGKLPDVFNLSSNLEFLETSNTIEYSFSGQGLVVSSIPDTLRLLVWSNINTTGLQYYTININNGMITKKITRTSPFLNSKYYKLPTITIPDSIVNRPISIGDFYEGGLLFHIFQSGENGYVAGETHGLVCDTVNLGSFRWGCDSVIVSGTSPLIGYGITNTQAIVNAGCGGTAAVQCYNLTTNGYSDWVLPSLNELDSMRSKLYKNGLGNFTNGIYVPSTDNGSYGSVKIIVFESWGGSWLGSKTTPYYVRPVRKF